MNNLFSYVIMETQTTLNGTESLEKSKKAEVAERIKRLTYPQDWTAYNLAVLVQESFELGLEIDLNFCAEMVLAQEQS